jgi:metabotropic glutamate receptor 6/7/8
VSFKGPQGTEIRFNEDGDALGYYNIYQYQRNEAKYDYVQIGTWKEKLTEFER